MSIEGEPIQIQGVKPETSGGFSSRVGVQQDFEKRKNDNPKDDEHQRGLGRPRQEPSEDEAINAGLEEYDQQRLADEEKRKADETEREEPSPKNAEPLKSEQTYPTEGEQPPIVPTAKGEVGIVTPEDMEQIKSSIKEPGHPVVKSDEGTTASVSSESHPEEPQKQDQPTKEEVMAATGLTSEQYDRDPTNAHGIYKSGGRVQPIEPAQAVAEAPVEQELTTEQQPDSQVEKQQGLSDEDIAGMDPAEAIRRAEQIESQPETATPEQASEAIRQAAEKLDLSVEEYLRLPQDERIQRLQARGQSQLIYDLQNNLQGAQEKTNNVVQEPVSQPNTETQEPSQTSSLQSELRDNAEPKGPEEPSINGAEEAQQEVDESIIGDWNEAFRTRQERLDKIGGVSSDDWARISLEQKRQILSDKDIAPTYPSPDKERFLSSQQVRDRHRDTTFEVLKDIHNNAAKLGISVEDYLQLPEEERERQLNELDPTWARPTEPPKPPEGPQPTAEAGGPAPDDDYLKRREARLQAASENPYVLGGESGKTVGRLSEKDVQLFQDLGDFYLNLSKEDDPQESLQRLIVDFPIPETANDHIRMIRVLEGMKQKFLDRSQDTGVKQSGRLRQEIKNTEALQRKAWEAIVGKRRGAFLDSIIEEFGNSREEVARQDNFAYLQGKKGERLGPAGKSRLEEYLKGDVEALKARQSEIVAQARVHSGVPVENLTPEQREFVEKTNEIMKNIGWNKGEKESLSFANELIQKFGLDKKGFKLDHFSEVAKKLFGSKAVKGGLIVFVILAYIAGAGVVGGLTQKQ